MAKETGNGVLLSNHLVVSHHTREPEIVEKQLDDLLTQGRIEESSCPWSSPVVLARN